MADPLPALLVTLSGAWAQGERERRQLYSVIHQLFWSERARLGYARDPEAFILHLKVLPRVKAALGQLSATLLARQLVAPELNWWSRSRSERDDGGVGQPSPSA